MNFDREDPLTWKPLLLSAFANLPLQSSHVSPILPASQLWTAAGQLKSPRLTRLAILPTFPGFCYIPSTLMVATESRGSRAGVSLGVSRCLAHKVTG